jgi:hypothetical protein
MVDADGGRPDDRPAEAECFDDVSPKRVPGLGAEATDALLGVVGVERRQVHQRDRSKQPCRLRLTLDGTPLRQAADPALQGGTVDIAHRFEKAEIERHAWVAPQAGRRRVGGHAQFDRPRRCSLRFQVGHGLAAHPAALSRR